MPDQSPAAVDLTTPLADLVNRELGTDFTADELDSIGMWRASVDFATIVSLLVDRRYQEARRLAMKDQATKLFSQYRWARADAAREARREDRKDAYITLHTSHSWTGPQTMCFVMGSATAMRCGKKAGWAILTDGPTVKVPYGLLKDTVLEYGAALECTLHATRVPPDYKSWGYAVRYPERAAFLQDNMRYLRSLPLNSAKG